jgi:hypothetical protein
VIIAILFILLAAWFPARIVVFYLLALLLSGGAPKATISNAQGIMVYVGVVSLFSLPFAVVQFAGSI